MEINTSANNTDYRKALEALRTGNSWSIAEFIANEKLPLTGAITSFTNEDGKMTRSLLLGKKSLRISSTIPNEELVDDAGRLNASTYRFHVVELINRYATTDMANPVLCYQIHRSPIGVVMQEVTIVNPAGLDDTLEQ